MKKVRLVLSVVVVVTAMMLTSSGPSSNEVTIGSQVWMTENLNVDKFSNGDAIPHAKTKEEWKKAGENKQPAWCYYDNDPANGTRYGKLYNWYAVTDSRGLAPQGFHIPSDAEWTQLTDYLGRESAAGTKMKSTSGWKNEGNGTNSSGFTGHPGGFRGFGTFYDIGNSGGWWSFAEYGADDALTRFLNYDNDSVKRGYQYKGNGWSVRCLRD